MMSNAIINKFGITRKVARKQIRRLVKKVPSNIRFFINEIKKLLRKEIIKSKKPYKCIKCDRKHSRGEIYSKHEKYIDLRNFRVE